MRLGTRSALLGMVAALSGSRLLGSVLFGVSATDATSFSRALAIVLGGAAVASLLPAWHAAWANPLTRRIISASGYSPVSYDLAVAAAFAALGTVIIAAMLADLVKRLRQERAAQPPEQRSRLWFLIVAGVGCYLVAYFAFGRNLRVPWLLALAVLAVGSIPLVRRLLP